MKGVGTITALFLTLGKEGPTHYGSIVWHGVTWCVRMYVFVFQELSALGVITSGTLLSTLLFLIMHRYQRAEIILSGSHYVFH